MKKMRYDRESRDRVKEFAQIQRRKPTPAEYHLRARLRANGEKRILRQCEVGRMSIDLALPSRNLLIEIDGPWHDNRKDQDARRDAWLKSFGFHVLRVTNEQVFNQPDALLETIASYQSSEDNRRKFFMSRRAAKAKSFWIEVQDPEKERGPS